MFDHFDAEADFILEEQIRICEIPAPTGLEAARAAYLAEQFEQLGLVVVQDEVGNVIGRLESVVDDPVVLSAHLDTVFGADQPVSVARPGESNPYRDGETVPEGEYHAPGISDAAAGLVAMLSIARTIRRTPWASELMFVATVGEEGRGDLRGARHLFETDRGRRARAFITIDHSDAAAVVNAGIGSRRYNVQYRGIGGHSWAHFGRYNPAFALAAAADRLAEVRVPRSPRTSYNVGVVQGGETVNAIPEFAEMDIDLRSESPEQLERLDEDVQEIIRRGHSRELRRRGEGAMEPVVSRIGDRPAGVTPADSALVRAACRALQAEGLAPRTIAASTDANAAMAAGVPAVAMSWGGRSDNQHSVREWFDPTDRSRSLRVITRMLLDLAQRGAV
ncbi:MAG: M20/M25/M40 family metallo-hydrolase [Chloroflexota bacterium]|nr:M20/M25/M40 family metallo-hydrolase [Chloroflexota bacterium]MDE2896487.1 M20/M25/M40 family metallo-hydrolase [Chloroflexota bacterium]